MDEAHQNEITRLVEALKSDRSVRALDRLFPMLYPELRQLASRYFRDERSNHTLQPTALVHEAYLRLLRQDVTDSLTRTHFFAITARVMRRVLIDHARARDRVRRAGGRRRIPLDPETVAVWELDELQALSHALDHLTTLDARQAEIVEMRFFGGLTVDEVARVLGVSKRTIESDWTHAKAWLRTELDRNDDQ